MVPFVYTLATRVTQYVLLPLYTRIQVTGAENVPMTGPLIIASNHLNDADPGILSTRIDRVLVFMTKVELFKIPGLAQFLRAYGAFPVRRGEADLGALRLSSAALAEGKALVIFPEGTREGPPEILAKAHPGAALLALRHDVAVLPVAIRGSGKLSLPGMFLRVDRRVHVSLTIGKPFVLEKPSRLNAEAVEAGTQRIMESIAALLPEGHRGYYEYISQLDDEVPTPPAEAGGYAGEP
jgi:1-acyl-sn-glycerol-3-phosphate acyltransferase